MRLLDRLDAIDRRLGLGPRAPRRAPNRLARWAAEHRWAYALAFAVVLDGCWVLTRLLRSREVSMGVFLFEFPFALALGLFVAMTSRNQCEAWDRRVAEGPRATPRHSPGPSGAQTCS